MGGAKIHAVDSLFGKSGRKAISFSFVRLFVDFFYNFFPSSLPPPLSFTRAGLRLYACDIVETGCRFSEAGGCGYGTLIMQA